MKQLELFEREPKPFTPRSRGWIKYRHFSIHERINWHAWTGSFNTAWCNRQPQYQNEIVNTMTRVPHFS